RNGAATLIAAAMDDADDAGASDTGHHVVAAKRLELVRDHAGGPHHIVQDFRMGVKILAPGGDFVVQFGDTVKNGHRGSEAVSFWVSVAAPIRGVNISMVLGRQPIDLSPHALFHPATTASFPRRRESLLRNGDPRFRGD